jgi:hypothetical protein
MSETRGDLADAGALLVDSPGVPPPDGSVDAAICPVAAAPVAEWGPAASALAMAGSSLYFIQNGDVFRVGTAAPGGFGPPFPVWMGGNARVLATYASMVYAGGVSQIVAIDDSDAGAGARVIVDFPSTFPMSMWGPPMGLAADGTSVYWTAFGVADPATPAPGLVRHDLSSPIDAGTVMGTSMVPSTMGSVAVDMTYAYTVDEPGANGEGTLFAFEKVMPFAGQVLIGPPRGALGTAPIVPWNGQVYFVGGAMAEGQILSNTGVGSTAVNVAFMAAPVTTFAIDQGWMFIGSGPNVLYAPVGQGSACVLATSSDMSPIQGIAAGNGYVAYFNMSHVGIVTEPR